MLREIQGKPLAVWVYSAVRASPLLDDVIVATDSEEILAACKQRSCNVRMTSGKHRSGTERVHEISQSIPADVYINVQGDEPMIRAISSYDLSSTSQSSTATRNASGSAIKAL